MTSYVENEVDVTYDFSIKEIVDQLMEQILQTENCPYEASVNVLLTDNTGIQEFNSTYRGIDRPTDVLSFPNLDFEVPGDFGKVEESELDYFDPDTGELLLGDIIISTDKVQEQADAYGHSLKREFAFLVAHSMLHLCGYDHMTEAESSIMERKQEEALRQLGITRE